MPQLIGNVVHKAVELLYLEDPDARTRANAAELLRATIKSELSNDTYNALLDNGDPRAEVLLAGEDALDGLFKIEDPRYLSVGPNGLEVWVQAELYGAPIRGRIDRIYYADGAEVIADYKTGKVPKPAYTQKAFFGLWTYAAGLAASNGDGRLADRIELLYLIGRERLARPVLRNTALEHAKTLARIWRAVAKGLQRGTVTARRSKLCDWCAFKNACPLFNQGPAVGTAEHDGQLAQLGLLRSDRASMPRLVDRLEQPLIEEG
jgi:putative RecB family exonuclease